MAIPAPRVFDDDRVGIERSFLLHCLVDMLRRLGDGDIADVLEGDPSAADRIADTERLAQAASIGFRLQRLAEERGAADARRRSGIENGVASDSALWGRALSAMLDQGLKPTEIAERLGAVGVEPVFTAHPTEAMRSSSLSHQRHLRQVLEPTERVVGDSTSHEHAGLVAEVGTTLELLWRSGEVLLDKPDVSAELRNVVHYLTTVMPEATRRLEERLDLVWSALDLDPALLAGSERPRVSFATWVGGDRDGHPLVTADVTAATLRTLRTEALGLIRSALEELGAVLSISGRLHPAPTELTDWINERAGELGDAGAAALERNRYEPWRQAVNVMAAGLPDSSNGAERTAEVLAADLDRLGRSLRSVGAERIADRHVDGVARLVRTFGFHLAVLDVRQNSQFHDAAIAQLLSAAGVGGGERYGEWSEAERRAFLDRELLSPRPFVGPRHAELGDEATAVLSCYAVLADEFERHGIAAIGSLIVSMTRSTSDLLAVYLFAREVGLTVETNDGPACPMPVVPLFETIGDLEASPGILDEFLQHPYVRRSLALRSEMGRAVDPTRSVDTSQQIMVGYSDSNKDGGIVASLWSVHRALIELTERATAAGVQPVYFHGRGGTVSRGAGPTHRFTRALPAGSTPHLLRLTEQGETIDQKYSDPSIAAVELETLLAGVAGASINPHSRRLDLEPPMQRLATLARDHYTALIESPGLITYFAQATPIDVIERSRIGSRPARRTGRRTLGDLRAIPWVFAWSQSRCFLSAWFGLGSSFGSLEDQDSRAAQQLMGAAFDWAPLHYLVSNSATAWASADPEIMSWYAELVDDDGVRTATFDTIIEEYHTTGRVLERIYGGPLNERRPNVEAVLGARRPLLRVLHRRQVDLLAEWRRAGATADGERVPSLLATVNAIANGLGTTG